MIELDGTSQLERPLEISSRCACRDGARAEPATGRRENAADPLALRPRGCAFSEIGVFSSPAVDGHLLGNHEHHPDKEVFGVLEVAVGLRNLRPAVTVLAVELEGDARE